MLKTPKIALSWNFQIDLNAHNHNKAKIFKKRYFKIIHRKSLKKKSVSVRYLIKVYISE